MRKNNLYKQNSLKLNESKVNVNNLISEFNSINESKLVERKQLAKKIVKESILLERHMLIEAAGQNLDKMAEMMDGMLLTAKKLAERTANEDLTVRLDTYHVPTDEEIDAMSVRKDNLKKFMKDFADVSSITKGLMALSDDVSNLKAGEGGAIAEIIKTLMAVGGPFSEGSLGDALFAYDNATLPIKKGGFLKGKTVKLTDKLLQAVTTTLKTRSPSSVKLLNPQKIVSSLLAMKMKEIVRVFSAYGGSVMHFVDNDFLLNMAKQPLGLGGVLKSISDMFMGSSMSPTK